MGKTGPKTQSKSLLRLWKNNENTALPFAQIISKAKQELKIEKRTTINYLNLLVEKQILEKQVDKERKTYYKLKDTLEYSREVLKAWIDFQESQILTLMHSFTLELSLNLEEQKRTGEPLDLIPVFEKTTETVLGELKAAKTIQDVVGKLRRKEGKE